MKWPWSKSSGASGDPQGAARHKRGKGDSPPPVQINLGAFGKHPGWDDHIENLGIETQCLADVKRLLYVEGIGGNIDSGAWDKLEDTQRLDDFHHIFLWRSDQDIIAGRFWSSRDGKGRTRYPMVVCAQCTGVPIAWVIDEVLPLLEEIEQGCSATTRSLEVRSLVDSARQKIRSRLPGPGATHHDPVADLQSLLQVADAPAIGEDQEGLLRVLYQLEREMPGLTNINQESSSVSTSGRAQQVRVPACEASAAGIVRLWTGFLSALLPQATPFVLLYPIDQDWVDLIVGQPVSQHFFAVKAHPSKLPLTTQIPYNLDKAFVEQAHELIRLFRQQVQAPVGSSTRKTKPQTRSAAEHVTAFSTTPRLIKIVAMVIAVVILIALIGFLWPRRGPTEPSPPSNGQPTPPKPRMAFDQASWEQWCEAYTTWLGRFLAQLDDPSRQALEADPDLRILLQTLDRVQASDNPLDPRKALNLSGMISRLAAKPPDDVKTPMGVEKTRRALEVIRSVQEGLAQWPLRVKTRQLAATFQSLGCSGVSAYLQSLADGVNTDADTDLYQALHRVLKVGDSVTEIEEKWTKIETHRSMITDTGDRILSQFGPWVEDAIRSVAAAQQPDLPRVRKKLVEIENLSQDLAHAVREDWPLVDQPLFTAESPVYQQSDPTVTADLFVQWIKDLKPYRRPKGRDDPRIKLEEHLARVRRENQRLKERPDYEPVAELDERLDQEAGRIRQLGALPWIARDADKIEQQSASIASQLNALERKIDQVLIELAQARDVYVAKRQAQMTLPNSDPDSDSEVINAHWRLHRDEIIAAEPDFSALKRKIESLIAYLSRLGQEFSLAPPPQAHSTRWGRRLARAVLRDQRDQAIKQLLDQTRWIKGEPVTGPYLQTQIDQSLSWYHQQREKLGLFVSDFITISQRLASCYGFTERPDQQDRSIKELYEKWAADELFLHPASQKALAPVVDQVRQLREVAQTKDRQVLWQIVRDNTARKSAAFFAAWLRLDEFAWPTDPSTRFEEMLDAQDQITLDHIEDDKRKTRLRDQMFEKSRDRWEKHVNKTTNPTDIDTAIDHLRDFEVYVDELDPRNRFNIWLYQLKKTDPQLGDDHLQRAVARFRNQVAQLPPAFNQRSDVAACLEQFNEVVTAETSDRRGDLSPEEMGPAASVSAESIPWEGSFKDEGQSLVYTWNHQGEPKHEIKFYRINPNSTGSSPFFLCTTEVSVGLFTDVVTATSRWPQFAELLRKYKRESPPDGPYVWKWRKPSGKKLKAKKNDNWLFGEFGKNEDTYPADIKVVKLDDDHPMQQCPAEAAMYFASLLGCQLPSVSQWQAAYQVAYDTYPEKSHPGPGAAASSGGSPDNLRDRAWLAQYDHVKKIKDDPRSPLFHVADWPDHGVFWPDNPDTPPRTEGDAQGYEKHRDDCLWFWAVETIGSGQHLRNLIGNVAEFVFDAPQAWDNLTRSTSIHPSVSQIRKLVSSHSHQLFVMGGSALSPPQLELNAAYPVDAKNGRYGFSDVGFRLALIPPHESIQQMFKRIVIVQPYLTP